MIILTSDIVLKRPWTRLKLRDMELYVFHNGYCVIHNNNKRDKFGLSEWQRYKGKMIDICFDYIQYISKCYVTDR